MEDTKKRLGKFCAYEIKQNILLKLSAQSNGALLNKFANWEIVWNGMEGVVLVFIQSGASGHSLR